MSRLMSVSHTEPQVRDRSKDVTRRVGWWQDKNHRILLAPGDQLTLCRKVMGRRKGEPLERICQVEVVAVRRERLQFITPREVAREGFPDWTPDQFIDFFTHTFGVQPDELVTRIEWRYLDPEQTP